MAQILIDSSVLVALYSEEDALRPKALKAVSQLATPLVVHEYVVVETATVLMLRMGKVVADNFLNVVSNNADFEILFSSESHFLRTSETFLHMRTKQLSFVDALLLALSDEYDVLTFDDALNRAIKKKN